MAAALEGITPVVRVASLEYSLVARALDCGAAGLIYPRVEERDELEQAVSWTRFPPEGVRGYGLTGTHLEYESISVPDAITHVNANILVAVQIETCRAVERVYDLLGVSGVDAVLVGPADLSIALGIPGEWDNPRLVAVIENVMEACVHHNKVPGIQTRSAAMARFWRDRGMRLVGCSNETTLLFEQAKTVVTSLRP
jgi:2-keto-3-deoxy-L-rhamnonate aldolase RhmA